MKNIKTKYSKGLAALAIFGLFSMVLGSLLIPISKAKAQEVVMVSVAINAVSASCNGQSARISWSSTNATNITISQGIGSVAPYGEMDVSPSQTTTYTITGTNSTGGFGTASATVFPTSCQQNPTVTLTANPSSIGFGETSTLTWSSSNANSCSGSSGTNGWSGSLSTSGSFNTGSLTDTTSFNITCINNSGGSASDSATVNVSTQQLNPTVNLTANPSSVNFGGTSTLTWSSSNAISCNASGGINGWSGPRGTSGSFNTGGLTNTTSFNITCSSNTSGSASDSATVSVGPQQQNPTVTLTANPSSVNSGGSSLLTWSSNNATSCNASGGTNGWSGSRSTSGSFNTGGLTNSTTFNITCFNSTGSANSSATVSVGGGGQNPTVDISADDTSIDEDDRTTVRWSSNNATSCNASGGNNGWSGSRSTSGSFSTGSLNDDETYSINCSNSFGSADDSVTIRVDEDDDNNDNDNEPDVTTRNATNIRTESATLNGRVDGNGSSVRAWFEYGTNTSLGSSTSQSSYGSGSTDYDRSISGLRENTTYYFRAMAENSDGTARGSILSFNTPGGFINYQPTQPTVVIIADQTVVDFNGATSIRWSTTNATSCVASGGSVGWAGAKNIGPSSFYTGSLTGTRTYSLTCTNSAGSDSDSVTVSVRGQQIVINNPAPRPAPSSLVIITSSVDRNQPIVPTLDNTRPRPGDEINYTVKYQNIGTGSITNLALRLDLPLEVAYMFSTPSNPTILGNTLFFNLGTLRANGEGTVTVRVRVRDNIPPGTNLDFPATLSYTDPSGFPQSVFANVSAEIWSEPGSETLQLGANVFGAGFLPTNLFGWLLLFILLLVLILLAKYLLDQAYRPKTATVYLPDSHRPEPRI